MPHTEIEDYDDAADTMNELRMRPELICIYMVSGLVSTRQRHFAGMKGMDVKCPIQGYAIWWLMKHFIIPATRHGVAIPGLDSARLNHGPSQRDAMETSATAKLAELTAVLGAQGTPIPDMGSLFFQVAAAQATGAQASAISATSPSAEDENDLFDEGDL